jgi:hypothetical protein
VFSHRNQSRSVELFEHEQGWRLPLAAPKRRNKVVKTAALIRTGASAACAILFLSSAGLGVSPAEATSSTARAKVPAASLASAEASPVNAKGPETTGSVEAAAEEEPNCMKSRRRLWVEGEGWVVRRVTTCF